MKIPLTLKCSDCGNPTNIRIHLDATSFDWKCDACDRSHPSFFGTEITIGFLLLERSRHELRIENDFSMSIILAAMAFEAELSRLFRKWTHIANLREGLEFDEGKCEVLLRSFKTIANKIEEVSNLMVPEGIESFVSADAELTIAIGKGFPSLNLGALPMSFQTSVFWPRNRNLHGGFSKHTEEDANRVYSIAWMGLTILQKMDLKKRTSVS